MTIDLVTHLPAIDHGHDAIYRAVDRLSKLIYFLPYKHTISDADLAYLFLSNVFACKEMYALIVSNCDV